MKMKSNHGPHERHGKFVLFVLFMSLVVNFLSSCASAPKVNIPVSPGGEFASLAPGGQVYFYADVKRAKPILAHVTLKNIDMKQAAGLLEKVDFLSGAVYPPPGSRTMLLHAWRQRGRIPGGAALALSPQWKKTASSTGARYWHSSAYGLSVSIQKAQAFVSDGDPFIDGPPVAPPEHLAELRRQAEGPPALVAGWVENAGTPINKFLSTRGLPFHIPTDQILFALYEAPADANRMYEIALRVETQNPSQARALTSILGLVRGFMEAAGPGMDLESLEILRPLLVNPPKADGSGLLIRTGPMSAEGIALLLNRFAVYSH
jgi:hypothetical protein